MEYNLIADSCCDLTDEMQSAFDAKMVPLTLLLGSREYIDDESLNVPEFIRTMQACTEKVGSAAPPPYLYEQAIRSSRLTSFIVTLSSRLSGSYNSAVAAMLEAERDGYDVHVFDSKSAAAGEVLVALKIAEFAAKGLSQTEIIEKVESFIKEMQTFFVLDRVDNLLKNGRLGKIAGKLISVLNIKPVLGSDGDGNIVQYSKARGPKQIVLKLIEMIENTKIDTSERSLVIAHCNNIAAARELAEMAKQKFHFRDIVLVPTKGLSSLYADDKGIIISY